MSIRSGNINLGLQLSGKHKQVSFEYVSLAIGLLMFVLLKLAYKFGDNDFVYALIYPTNYLFSITENSTWHYSSDLGFYHQQLQVIIDKSCSGGNFFILTLCLIYFTGLNIVNSIRSLIVLILISSAIGYIYTILVNVSRISIISTLNEYDIGGSGWTHEAIGSFVYLSALMTLYLFQNVITNKLLINE